MKVTLRASSGTPILVWRQQGEFFARRADAVGETQTCLGVDLFEVIAELADLDLDSEAGAREATRLSEEAHRRLTSVRSDDPDDQWPAQAQSDRY